MQNEIGGLQSALCLLRNMQIIFWERRKSIVPATRNDFRDVFRHMKMSGSATPATQNNITTCFETLGKERFSSFLP